MTQENTQHRYSITDILGAPCSEEEARRRIREETDLTTLNVFHSCKLPHRRDFWNSLWENVDLPLLTTRYSGTYWFQTGTPKDWSICFPVY